MHRSENERRRGGETRQKGSRGIEDRAAHKMAFDHPVNDAFAVRAAAEDASNPAVGL